MKKIIFLSLIIALAIGSCTQQQGKFPQGAWQLVEIQRVANDSVINLFPDKYSGSDIKMWSEKHFLSLGRIKIDTTFINNSVGGTYTIKGNRYEEDLLYVPNQSQVGQKVKALLDLRNDTLIQSYPVDDSGQPVKSGYYIEKYIKLK